MERPDEAFAVKGRAYMRIRMTMLFIFARLSWGEFNSPLFWRNNRLKIFPPPQVMVYKESLANYFSRN